MLEIIYSNSLLVSNAQRVVYSTCSLFEEENEQVVLHILETMGDKWELHRPLPQWKHRGLKKYPTIEDYCIRAAPAEDETNGFFVARFHRKQTPAAGKREKMETNDEQENAEVIKKPKNTVDEE